MISFRKRLLSIVLVMILMITTISGTGVFIASTASMVTITSVSNARDGVKVKWKKDSSKSGYYIYRKTTSASKWTKVKTVKGGNYSSWIDSKAANGQKYDYKVEAYRGKKLYKNTVRKTIYRLSAPTIKSFSYDGDSIHIKGSENSSARGFEIQYSTSSNFANSESLKVWSTQVDKTIANLSCSKKYYFRIRAFRISGDVTYYSNYSKYRSYNTKPSYDAYTLNLHTSIYKEPNNSSKKVSIDYMTKVRLYQDYYIGSEGLWKKLSYNNEYYYVWIPNNTVKFTTEAPTYEYDLSNCTTHQREIIEMALDIYKNYDTEYDYTKEFSDGSVNPETGKYSYDCSGLIKHVYNSVMRKYVKTYKIPWNITDLFNTKTVYNNGLPGEFNAVTVCEGKYDYSKLQPGDVLFFNLANGRVQDKDFNHCGIYLGNKEFIHSTGSLYGVSISLISGTYEDDFVKAVRYIPDEIELVNATITAPKNISVYGDMACKTGTSVFKIPKNSEFTLVCTNANVGFVEFTDTDGKVYSGYIYKPQNSLSDFYASVS